MTIGVGVGRGVGVAVVSGVLVGRGATSGLGVVVPLISHVLTIGASVGIRTDGLLETYGLLGAEPNWPLCRAAWVMSLGGMANVGAGVGPDATVGSGEAVGSGVAVQAEKTIPRMSSDVKNLKVEPPCG